MPSLASRIKPRLGSRLNRSHALARGLEACWLFNEGQGNVAYDLTGNSHNLHLGQIDTDKTFTAWTGGQFGGPALRSFPTGTSPTSTISPSQILLPNSARNTLTVEWWLQQTTIIDYQCLGTQGSSIGFYLKPNSPYGQLLCYVGGDFPALTLLPTQTWVHLVAVMQRSPGNLVTFYVNGRKDTTVNPGVNLGNWSQIDSVLNNSNSETFIGLMDLMRVWSRDLDAGEVQQLYREPFGMCVTPRRYFYATPAPAVVTGYLTLSYCGSPNLSVSFSPTYARVVQFEFAPQQKLNMAVNGALHVYQLTSNETLTLPAIFHDLPYFDALSNPRENSTAGVKTLLSFIRYTLSYYANSAILTTPDGGAYHVNYYGGLESFLEAEGQNQAQRAQRWAGTVTWLKCQS